LTTTLLLLLGGCITVLPLALFATAAQRVSLSTLGILQYVGPTLQFLVGVVLYGEPLNMGKLVGFGLVWIGSIAFLSAVRRRTMKLPVAFDEPDPGSVAGGLEPASVPSGLRPHPLLRR
jgi:chloramphenicol-sensitive protein RarD